MYQIFAERRFLIGIFLIVALVAAGCVSSADTAVNEPEREDQGGEQQNTAALDQTVKGMLEALERGDYDGFSAYYAPGKKHSLSDGGASAALSKEQFDAVRARFLEKGRRLASMNRMSGSKGERMQDADYRLEFENRDFVARLRVLGRRDAIEHGVINFSLCWVGRDRLETADRAAENFVKALYDGDYGAFAEGFSPMLRQRYTPEEFQYLRKHLLAEKGDYRERVMEDFLHDEERRTTTVTNRLVFADETQGQDTIRLTVEVNDERAPMVRLAWIDWLPNFEKEQMDQLAETALTTVLNGGSYESFLACSGAGMGAALPKDKFEEFRRKILELTGKYHTKSFYAMRVERPTDINGEIKQLTERRIFIYKLKCEKTDTMFLYLTADRIGERFYLHRFHIQEPNAVKYIGNLND